MASYQGEIFDADQENILYRNAVELNERRPL